MKYLVWVEDSSKLSKSCWKKVVLTLESYVHTRYCWIVCVLDGTTLEETYGFMTVCYHVTYEFQSEDTHVHSIVCLNVKKLLARSRHHIWSLNDSNEIRTHNHLSRNRTLNHLPKLASLTKWLSVCGFESRCCHLCDFIVLDKCMVFSLNIISETLGL